MAVRRRIVLLASLFVVLVAGPAAAAQAATLRGISAVTGGSVWEQWIQGIQSSAAVEACSPRAPLVHLRFNRTPPPGFRIRWAAFLSPSSVPVGLAGPVSGSVPASDVGPDGTIPLPMLLSRPGYAGSNPVLRQLPFVITGTWTFTIGVWGSDEPYGWATAFARPRTFRVDGRSVPYGACAAAGYETYFVL